MDDDMEDEIIYELFTAHAHILWRYLGVTTAGLVELILPGPGETVKMKIFQPGPFMFVIFMVIVASVVLQSSSHLVRHWMLRLYCTLGLNSVTDSGLKSFGGIELVAGAIGTDNVVWEFKDGIVGVYSMQGRRASMEDRFNIILEEDVGGKNMSFFGVFDGHGGQYTAEYVKTHLFRNTIDKIKQLRSQASCSKNGNNNISGTNDKNPSGSSKHTNSNSKLTSPNSGKSPATTTTTNTNRKLSVSEGENTKKSDTVNPTTKTDDEKSMQCTSNIKSDVSEHSNLETETGSCVEILSQTSSEPQTCASGSPAGVSLKKDELYSSVTAKKRNSVSGGSSNGNNNNDNSNINGVNKEKKDDSCSSSSSPESGYIDSYKNINYTKLLTDQIMTVDKQVVQHCKSKTDMSGTTAVIALLDGELLIIGNVGDSRAVMGDSRGSTIPLSFDHKPNQLKERRRIKEAGGFITFSGVWRVAGVLATSRALGDFTLKEPHKLVTAEPDVLTFSLRDHKAQFVILATDGLWDVFSNEEAVAFVREHIHESDFGARSLCLSAYNRGSQDNITVTILNIAKLGL